MKANNEQKARLHQALMDAFPRVQDLEMLLSFGLDEDLSRISGARDSLQQAAFEVVRWADKEGRLSELALAAVRENRVNPRLRSIADELCPAQDEAAAALVDPALLSQWDE